MEQESKKWVEGYESYQIRSKVYSLILVWYSLVNVYSLFQLPFLNDSKCKGNTGKLHSLLKQTPPPPFSCSAGCARLLDYLKIMSSYNYHHLLNQVWHRKIMKYLNQGILLCHTLGSAGKSMEQLLILKMRWKMF